MECHGTGTALGDPIETGALKATLAQGARGDLGIFPDVWVAFQWDFDQWDFSWLGVGSPWATIGFHIGCHGIDWDSNNQHWDHQAWLAGTGV